MRLTRYLCKQDIGWHLKTFWAQNRIKKIEQTGVEKKLQERGIPVIKAEDFMREKYEIQPFEVVGFKDKPIVFDRTHPNWHDRTLLTYKDNNVLLEGLTQAKILTNTVELKQGLPDSLVLKSTKDINKRVKEIILTSHVFDAQQEKLPKLKDPERPAWNFPRVYGITQPRVIKLLLVNLLQLIENSSDVDIVKQRYITENTIFSYNFEKYGDLIQFEVNGDTLLTSQNPLKPITSESTEGFDLPDIDPIKPTITLNEENIYEVRQIYPISLKFPKSHPHTIFIPYIETEVKNLFEEPVTENQIYGRSLLKTFTVAASYAREKFGDTVKTLPKPVTVQCVHTNGKLFHFGIFQLNTLDLGDSRVKNIWYQTDRIPLFDECCYKVGRPVLEGYNKQVVQYLNAFYNNI